MFAKTVTGWVHSDGCSSCCDQDFKSYTSLMEVRLAELVTHVNRGGESSLLGGEAVARLGSVCHEGEVHFRFLSVSLAYKTYSTGLGDLRQPLWGKYYADVG